MTAKRREPSGNGQGAAPSAPRPTHTGWSPEADDAHRSRSPGGTSPAASARRTGAARRASARSPRSSTASAACVVGRGALAVQGDEGVAVAGQRPPAALGARPGGLGVDVDEHGDVVGQRAAHALGAQRAAAQRDDAAVGALEQLPGDLLLPCAEPGLALAVEERRDRLPQPLLEQPVGVLGPLAQRCRDLVGHGRLPRAHEADEDERPTQRRHPIRCWYASTAARVSSMWSPPNFAR